LIGFNESAQANICRPYGVCVIASAAAPRLDHLPTLTAGLHPRLTQMSPQSGCTEADSPSYPIAILRFEL